jgi:hypothetical protein
VDFGAWDYSWGFYSIVGASLAFEFELTVMKAIAMALTVCGFLLFSGCATHHGGTEDDYNTSWGSANNPASPTFRPGMNPDDIRDPNSVNRPLPTRPTTPP